MNWNWANRFWNDERGSATIEALLWIPIFVYLLVLITDVSLNYYGKAQALRTIQDGNRALSVRFLPDATAAQDFIETRLQGYAPSVEVTTSISNGIVTTSATMLASELMAVGSIPTFRDTEISVTAQHFLEQ
jgi:Flp pilus assembly protein TadG